MTEPILRVTGLSKSFGGLAAVSDVSLELRRGEVHAVIGPNGAGKTTLINMLSGDLAPSAGAIRFEGREIAGLSADGIARLGIGRSYQKANIFPEFSLLENCRLAAQARLRSSLRFFRPALAHAALTESAIQALALVGLEEPSDRLAGRVSHGEQRQLEIAMVLATEPRVLLLDEPLAGMGAEESQRMVALIAQLAETHAVLLVEHDMDAVFSVASVLTVMVNGRVLERGAPAAIRESPAVQQAYLGTAEMVS
jgi:branched-chain amino acid transport system ATP-binding protein